MCSYRRMRGLVSEEVRDTKLLSFCFLFTFYVQFTILSYFAYFTENLLRFTNLGTFE